MSYDINAWLEDGEPRLQIIDADSGTVRLAWCYRKPKKDEVDAEHDLERLAVKELFQELFLLSSLRAMQSHRKTKPRQAIGYANAAPRNGVSVIPSSSP